MKRKLMLLLILCMCFLVGCGGDDEKESGKNSETQQESEVDKESEKVANMTEEEYKAYCEVIYSDDLFERDDIEGKHVKIYGIVEGIGLYSDTDLFADVIENVAKKYDLSKEYIPVRPAYKALIANDVEIGFNFSSEKMYLLFEYGKDSAIYEYKRGDEITIYGEVVQCWSGPFVIPKYIENTEITIPDMSSTQE